METRINPVNGKEMEIMRPEEAYRLAKEAGVAEWRIDRFFSNGQDFAWAEYIREVLAKANPKKPQTTSEKFGLRHLDTGGDLKGGRQ